MSGVDRWASRLGQSDRTRRVLSEAALDWQHEVAAAKTMSDAVWRHARAGVGFARACLSVCADGLADAMSLTWVLRLLLAFAIVSALYEERLIHIFVVGHGDWQKMVVDAWTLFGSQMPWILALAVMTGPRRAPSPLVGFVGLGLVSAVVFGAYWPILLRQVLMDSGHPLPADAALLPPGFLTTMLLFTIGWVLLADRLRQSEKRIRSIAVNLALVLVAVYAMNGATNALRLVGLSSGVAGDALRVTFVAVPFALWLRLVRREAGQIEVAQ